MWKNCHTYKSFASICPIGKKLGGGGGIEADVDGKTETKKKVKELKVLSAKEAQNLCK